MEVLRDTGCSGVIIHSFIGNLLAERKKKKTHKSKIIIKRELVGEADFTGEIGHIMTADR